MTTYFTFLDIDFYIVLFQGLIPTTTTTTTTTTSTTTTTTTTPLVYPDIIEMVQRKPVGNPDDFFSKTFAEYKAGFSSKGDIM